MTIQTCSGRGRLFFLVVLVSCGLIAAAQTAPPRAVIPPPAVYAAPDRPAVLRGDAPLRVLLKARLASLAWKGSSAVKAVALANDRVILATAPGEQIGLRRAETGVNVLRKEGKDIKPLPGAFRLVSDAAVMVWTPTPDTWTEYPAPLVIIPMNDGTFTLCREVLLEEYLRDVLPAEMPRTFHPQALRAQAILARTYTLNKLGRHADAGADLCANEHCQMFTAGKRAASTDDAAHDTKGVVLMAGETLAEVYYHASCGGVTDDAGYVWGPEYARPYLTGTSDCPEAPAPTVPTLLGKPTRYCAGASSLSWEKRFTAAEVNALVSANLSKVTGDANAKIARVTDMTIEERTPRGRVLTLRVEGEGASLLVAGDAIRWLFGTGAPGPGGLWSTLFDLDIQRDAAGTPMVYTVRGVGRGHGLGLCQWGAEGRARAGQDARTILRAYFPGSRLSDEQPPAP